MRMENRGSNVVLVPSWMRSAFKAATDASVASYLSGGLFALALFFCIDAAAVSRSPLNGSEVHVTFWDWTPAICSVLGMIIVEFTHRAESGLDSFLTDTDTDARKRVNLFIGFALLCGGLAGSICFLIVKYLTNDYSWMVNFFGVESVIANLLIMMSTGLLWYVHPNSTYEIGM